MKVLLASSEAVPFAKTGGLADVAGALPKALERLGVDVRLILPKYKGIEEKGLPINYTGVRDLRPRLADGRRGRDRREPLRRRHRLPRREGRVFLPGQPLQHAGRRFHRQRRALRLLLQGDHRDGEGRRASCPTSSTATTGRRPSCPSTSTPLSGRTRCSPGSPPS